MNLNPENIFGPKGPLSKKLQYFEYRPSQVEYSQAVRNLITKGKIGLLEAQTGTGKTLAYLIPALESGKRVMISTGTKALQEQLYHKDIPLLQKKLGLQFSHVLMKGRMNYLCLLKHERAQIEPMLPDKNSVNDFEEIQSWVTENTYDFIGRMPGIKMPSLQSVLHYQTQTKGGASSNPGCESSSFLRGFIAADHEWIFHFPNLRHCNF
jgi:DEAD/DEAH box helicase